MPRDLFAFRGRKTAAPLKPLYLAPANMRDRPSFRGRKTAAPLKLVVVERFVGGGDAFRGRKTAAPLKRGIPTSVAIPQILPRSKDRGPIEARRLGSLSGLLPTPFRGRKTAAPLKPRRLPHSTSNQRSLPRSKDRGPIEARQWPVGPWGTEHPSAVERPRPH